MVTLSGLLAVYTRSPDSMDFALYFEHSYVQPRSFFSINNR